MCVLTAFPGCPLVVFTHADGSRWVIVFIAVCMFYQTIPQKLTKLGTGMFHPECWQPIYFGVKRSQAKTMRHKRQCRCGFLYSCECWFLLIHHLYRKTTSGNTCTGFYWIDALSVTKPTNMAVFGPTSADLSWSFNVSSSIHKTTNTICPAAISVLLV